jgi:hypothetical protein
MTDVFDLTGDEYAELQRRFGGRCVVRRGAEVLASAERFDDLMDQLIALNLTWDDLIVEYIEPADRVVVY